MITNHFELCTMILLENVSEIEECYQGLYKTFDSLLDQTKRPVKICVLASNCTISDKNLRMWSVDLAKKLKEEGIINFSFVNCIDKTLSLKTHIKNTFDTFINRNMPIIIHSDAGDKKSSLKLSHFAIIPIGNTYGSKKYYEHIRDLYFSDKKNIITYSDIEDKDGSITKIEKNNLTDKSPLVYYSYGFKHFIAGNRTDSSIVSTFRKIDEERKKITKKNSVLKDIDQSSYSDAIFKKSIYTVKIDE